MRKFIGYLPPNSNLVTGDDAIVKDIESCSFKPEEMLQNSPSISRDGGDWYILYYSVPNEQTVLLN